MKNIFEKILLKLKETERSYPDRKAEINFKREAVFHVLVELFRAGIIQHKEYGELRAIE